MRRFYLQRNVDESGVSGTGLVAEGLEFDTGLVTLLWLTEHSSVTIFSSLADMLAVHGHQGKTVPLWLDDADVLPLAALQQRAFTLAARTSQSLLLGLAKQSATQAMVDWKARARAERQAQAVFNSAYTAQQQAILRAVNRAGELDTSAAYIALLDPAFADTRDVAVLATLPFYDALLRQAIAEGSAQTHLGVDWDQANAAVHDLAQQKAQTFAEDMTTTSQAQTYDAITNWIASGETMAELQARLALVWEGPRPDVAAITEVTDTFAEGNILAWQQSRVVTAYRFRTAHDGHVCDICEPFDGEVFPLDDEEHRPSLHGRCRCGITPVVEAPE